MISSAKLNLGSPVEHEPCYVEKDLFQVPSNIVPELCCLKSRVMLWESYGKASTKSGLGNYVVDIEAQPLWAVSGVFRPLITCMNFARF